MATEINYPDPYEPGPDDAAQAESSNQELVKLIMAGSASNARQAAVEVTIGGNVASLTIPMPALAMLSKILSEMSSGNAVSIVPIHAELTTQEAADILNVSRPFIVDKMDQGVIPHHKVGTHRRVKYKDLLEYKAKLERESKQAMEDLVRLSQELDLGY